MSQSWQNSLRCSEESSRWIREEEEEGEEGEEGGREEEGSAEEERGVLESGTSVGANSLSFSKSCFQKKVLRVED